MRNLPNCDVVIVGAGPYGLSAAAFLRSAGVETRVFGEPMSFWDKQMPAGMFLRSNWGASHIADPHGDVTLDAYKSASGNHLSAPIPLNRFVDYGRWYQQKLVPHVENRQVTTISKNRRGFEVVLDGEETFGCRRIVIAVGISGFASRPAEFEGIPAELASHSADHRDLAGFRSKSVVVIGAGQSALEAAALLHEAGAQVEVVARQRHLNWVGLHSWLHHLGPLSKCLYSKRDVGPAGLSRLVSMPRLFKVFPRKFQQRASYRSIRPAGSSWLQPRLANVRITLGRKVISARVAGSRLRLTLDDAGERMIDHAILATGFRVDVSGYKFLSPALKAQLQTAAGYPVLKRGLESSMPGLHFLGRPAAWSFGPLLCFVSGTEFAANELLRSVGRKNAR